MSLNVSAIGAVIVSILVYVSAYFLLTHIAERGLTGTAWFSETALGGQVIEEDAFSLPVGDGNHTIDAVRENMTIVFAHGTLILMVAGCLFAFVWVVWWRFHAPRVSGPEAGRSGKLCWLVLLLMSILVYLGVSYYEFNETSIRTDLNPNALSTIAAVYFLATVLLFWIATAWSTPNVLRPSVPLSSLMPLHSRRR